MANTAQKILNRVYPPRNMLFYLQRNVLNPRSRQRISRLIAGQLRKAPAEHLGATSADSARVLDDQGYVMLPNLLSPQQIEEVHSFLDTKQCVDRWKPNGGRFHVSNAPGDCHTADFDKEVVISCPHLLETANHPLVLEVVSRLLGCKPTISSLNIWWSLSGHTAPQEAENFHRDVDEWHFIKLFVYLTDVVDTSGPHVFVKGTQREAKLLPIRRYTDAEVEQTFGADRVHRFTGPAGTNFLENTFGFHKGQMPTAGRRLLFQSQYSLLPIHLYKYQQFAVESGRAKNLDPYINRLYVSAEKR